MPSYTFNPNGALDVGSELTSVTTMLENALEDLQTKVVAFQNANQGLSIDNYQTAQAQWSQGETDMNNALGAGVTALNNIHDEYVLADNRGAAAFSGTV